MVSMAVLRTCKCMIVIITISGGLKLGFSMIWLVTPKADPVWDVFIILGSNFGKLGVSS